MGAFVDTPINRATEEALDDSGNRKPKGDPYKDLNAAYTFLEERLVDWMSNRYVFERDWYRNVLYYAGNQWIIYQKQARRWRARNLPGWFPKPVTNKFAEKTNDIISSLRRPTFSYTPTSDKTASVALAEMGSHLEKLCWKEAGMDQNEPYLRAWLVLTGNVFLVQSYDESLEHGTFEVPASECTSCGLQDTFDNIPLECPNEQCPSRQPQAMLGPEGQPQVDPLSGVSAMQVQQAQFKDIKLEYPKGKMVSEVVSPFEIYCDGSTPKWSDHQGFARVRAFPVRDAKAIARKVFKDMKGLGQELQALSSQSQNAGALYLSSLAYVTATFGSLGTGAPSPKTSGEDQTTISEMWHLPTEQYPQGCYIIRFGNNQKLTKIIPLPSKRRDGSYFLPAVHFGGDVVPGRFWRKTRMDDLVYKQNQRNLLEAMIMLAAQRMGSPAWLIPRGAGVGLITGEPAIRINYNILSAGGNTPVKPERLSPEQLNQSVLLFIQEIDESMERIAGTFFLQGGDTPPGVTAASALAYLGEKAQRAMSSWFQSYEDNFAMWLEQCLEILRVRAPEERVLMGAQATRWEAKRFIMTDLKGEIEIKAEAGSAFPQSQAAVRATIQSLIELGLINVRDPMTAYNILQHAGLAHLSGAVDDDFKIAAEEFDMFLDTAEQTGVPPDVDPVFDNHFAHFMQHKRDAQTDKFRKKPPQIRALWTQHTLNHLQNMQEWAAAGFTVPRGGEPPDVVPIEGADGKGDTRPPQGKKPPGTQGQTIPSIKDPQVGGIIEEKKSAI